MNANFRKGMVGVALAVSSIAAQATPSVLSTGLLQMGVGDTGGLGQGTPGGVAFVGPTGDAISPGCLCEGWGASANGVGNWTDGNYGDFGIVSALMTTTVASGPGLAAQDVVVLANGLKVTQTYSYAAGGTLFGVTVTLTNTTGAAMTDVRYARTLDWDVTPGYFEGNYTTVYGGTPTGIGGDVLNTSTNPFAPADPTVFRTQDEDTNVVNTPGDEGGYFVFGFGGLDAGASTSFTTYIGADTTVSSLLADLGSVGVEAYSYTTGDATGADGDFAPAYGYGFVGLGLPPSLGTVPEPTSIALLGIAALGLAASRRRRT